uniref:Adhesion G protein-coupled receptor G7 n=1 Tax=Pipistrellus kuhlii TaxID=59472 RepID=A0A7J8A3F1_PIPKU|nr:adhesion G protein-coupled receptor G7 [Pipistrellus kuhlii]
MAACRVCDLRVLVAIVCGLLTAVTLGLTTWMAVKILTETPPSSGRPFKGDCRNGGTWQNGTCLCTEDWKGLRCTIINFCPNSTSGNFTFGNISVGRYGPSLETCGRDTHNAGSPRATRLCYLTEDGEIELQNATIADCNTNLETLGEQLSDSSENAPTVSKQVLILTSNITNLEPQNITSATKVVGQIFNITTNDSAQAKIDAVTTVSQLLGAKEEVFKKAVAEDEQVFSTLVTQMETYSWSLGNNSVVNPNIAIQSFSLPPEDTGESTGVLFTVDKGASNSLVSGSTSVESNKDGVHPNKTTELQIWLNTPKSNATSYGFIVYQNSKLFQSKIFKSTSNDSIRVVSSTANNTGNKQNISVQMAFRQQYTKKKFQSYACVYWNTTKKDWDTDGCFKDVSRDKVLYCRCNHTTNFAVLLSFTEANYPGLNELTSVGCALSITGLILTIIFQIVTRKVRKTSVTWVLVSLCTSMLIFNLLFVNGIENKNKYENGTGDANKNEIKPEILPNKTCTAIAILLHYFLLAMFTWTGVSAVQLYFLLIRTMKPLPQRFTLYMSLIGWGVPAIMVAMTVGIIFSQDSSQWDLNYRQEEICWLALTKENEFKRSPLLWSVVLPVAIILTNNVVLYIIIIVKVVWKNDQNLTSTKKVSLLKKVFSTLSIAVIFGITWILGFVMLTHDGTFRDVLSYIFCIFNTTQGLQIFILYTVRTKIFQNEAAKMLKLLSSSADRVKLLPSKTRMRLRARMYNMLSSFPALNERFRLLEPAVVTEEMTLSESDQASISI